MYSWQSRKIAKKKKYNEKADPLGAGRLFATRTGSL
jgi:hypothetical protein